MKSQNQKIINCLVKHSGAWVRIESLTDQEHGENRAEYAVRYEINELKKRGYEIEHRKNPVSGNSEYRVSGKAVEM